MRDEGPHQGDHRMKRLRDVCSKSTAVLCILFGLMAAVPGCGDDSTGGSSAGSHVEALISAKNGGTIKASGVSATIPAGALAKDTTITVDIKDKSGFKDADT